jgi:hypothetical protein
MPVPDRTKPSVDGQQIALKFIPFWNLKNAGIPNLESGFCHKPSIHPDLIEFASGIFIEK